jgi:hypothetical protein
MFIEAHISHLRNKNEDELNRLLRMVVDIDNMGTAMSREENVETKKVYTYLFHVTLSYIVMLYFTLNSTFLVIKKMYFNSGQSSS